MYTQWIISGLVLVCFTAVMATRFARTRQRRETAALMSRLLASPIRPAPKTVSMNSIAVLPPPVARYFRYALREGQPFIHVARYEQNGRLRTDTRSERWLSFQAIQIVMPQAHGFIWDARIHVAPLLEVRVHDAYLVGQGEGRISVLSTFTVAAQQGCRELNAGALHRYLAEAVWYPTALLPEAGVQWTAIDENRALATLSDSGITVSLEFRFNDVGEITGIYTPGRWGSFDGRYKLTPWEGHFRRYEERAGMRIPVEGEVGWYVSGELLLVWKGHIHHLTYEFA